MSILSDDNNESKKAFTIQCEGEGIVVVGELEARKILARSEFFRNVFKHNTREAEERVVRKPDWSIETTTHIVQYLVTLKTEFDFDKPRAIADFVAATMSILVGWRIRCPLKSLSRNYDIGKDHTQALLRALVHQKSKFQLTASVCGVAWQVLIDKNVLLCPEQGTLTFDALKCEETREQVTKMAKTRWIHKQGYCVSSMSSLSATVAFICGVFHAIYKIDPSTQKRVKKFTEETFSVRLALLQEKQRTSKKSYDLESEATTGLWSGLFEVDVDYNSVLLDLKDQKASDASLDKLVEKCSGGSGATVYLHKKPSPGYYLLHDAPNSAHVTISGSSEQLTRALYIIQSELPHMEKKYEMEQESCAFRVTAPSRDTVGLLVNASLQCNEKPGTLGADFRSNAMYAIKSFADINRMLAFLSGTTKGDAIVITDREFHLVELDCPCHPF